MSWNKVENETGYPCYVHNDTREQQMDHPEFSGMLECLRHFNDIKYSAYRLAFKVFTLQKILQVPPLHISAGVFTRHCLSLSETSLTLEASELEAVLTDVFFAAEKEGLFNGDVDKATDFTLNLMLNVYDKDRKVPIRVLAAKTLLTLLGPDSPADKWSALASYCADHNDCISVRRLTALLGYVADLAKFLGEDVDDVSVQADVDACFEKSAGMLGMSTRSVCGWALAEPGARGTKWLSVLQRLQASRQANPEIDSHCSACGKTLAQVLQFGCSKCTDKVFCEKCYLYDNDLSVRVNGHKKSHVVNEIVEYKIPKQDCTVGLKRFKKLFGCKKRKKSNRKPVKNLCVKPDTSPDEEGKTVKPNHMFTSTVGKAGGHAAQSPATLLQDIIGQLDSQNRALKELSQQLRTRGEGAELDLRLRVDAHCRHIATQINRLNMLKENLSLSSGPTPTQTKSKEDDRPQAFDLFSPIPMLQDEKSTKISNDLKNQPRLLSLDSGNFSVASKPSESENLLTLSGDALKPVAAHTTSDSISTVSMNDISSWFGNEAEKKLRTSTNQNKMVRNDNTFNLDRSELRSNSICVTERRYDADLQSVAASNHKMKELNADLDTVLDRLQQILTNNFVMDDSCFDNSQLRETATEMEGLLGSLIRGVEQRVTKNDAKKVAPV